MKIGILANEGSWYFRDLERASAARGHICRRLDFERLVVRVSETGVSVEVPKGAGQGEATGSEYSVISTQYSASQDRQQDAPHSCDDDLRPMACGVESDVIVVRTMPPGSLEQVVYRMDVLGRIEAAGVPVINSPKSLECAVDKFLTTARLQAAGLPVPETIVCEHEDDALLAFEQLGRDVVVKPLFGAEGRGIVRVSDPDLAHRTFRTLMRIDSVLYLQKYIDHEGYDVRVLVMGGRVLGSMRRRSPHDFRTNVARSAIGEAHNATVQEVEFALRAVEATGAYIGGVDVLYDRRGACYVIEVNAVPGWQAFSRTTGIDVAAKFVESLEG